MCDAENAMTAASSARVTTHWLEPEDDGGGELESGKEDCRASIVAGSDAAPVLQTTEHNLDTTPASVAALVKFDGDDPLFSARNAKRYALA